MLLVNVGHSRPFLPCGVMQKVKAGKKKKVCAIFFLPNLFLSPILVFLLPAYLHFHLISAVFSFVLFYSLTQHSSASIQGHVRGMYAH